MTTSADTIFRSFQANELGVIVTKRQKTLVFKTPPAKLTNVAKTALEKLGLTVALYKQSYVLHAGELAREQNFTLCLLRYSHRAGELESQRVKFIFSRKKQTQVEGIGKEYNADW